MDVITGSSRFTFGTTILSGGIGVLPLLVGLFCHGAGADRCDKPERAAEAGEEFRLFMLSPEEWKMIFLPMLVAAVTGIVIGIAPGAGGAIACFMGYELSKRWRAVRSCTEGLHRGAGGVRVCQQRHHRRRHDPAYHPGRARRRGDGGDAGGLYAGGNQTRPTLFQEYGTEMQTFFLAFIVMQFVILILGGLGTGCGLKSSASPVHPHACGPAVLLPGSLLSGRQHAGRGVCAGLQRVGVFHEEIPVSGAPSDFGVDSWAPWRSRI